MPLRAREASAYTNVFYWHHKTNRLTSKRVLKGSSEEAIYKGADFREKKPKQPRNMKKKESGTQ